MVDWHLVWSVVVAWLVTELAKGLIGLLRKG